MSNFFFVFLIFISYSNGCRPDPSSRAFTSTIIDNIVTNITSLLKDPLIAKIFNCSYPNTLDTTVQYTYSNNKSNIDTFIITGDINAMWLRDSTWQVNGYLPYISYNKSDNNSMHLYNMLYGLHNRQLNSVIIDAYANAFNKEKTKNGPHMNDIRTPPMNDYIFEGKYELDSLLCVLYFTYSLFEISKDMDLLSDKYINVVNIIYDHIKYQQQPTYNMSSDDELYYSFLRETTVPTDTLIHSIGPPGLYTGMIRTAFRPSDDATRFPFNIASNAFAVSILNKTANLFLNELNNNDMYNKLMDLSIQINNGINNYGIIEDNINGNYYAFEVDGYGSRFIMDGSNIPSLLSMPYLGYLLNNDTIYENTRKKIFNINSNPYYFNGKYGNGIGSPHTYQDWIWPMSIIMRAITSNDDNEIIDSLNILKNTTNNTWFMHESFYKNDPSYYTRSWFAWCNNLFGDLILRLVKDKPYLVI